MFVPGAAQPATFGGEAPEGNFGTMRTTGWELSVDFNHRFSNGINFSATLGFSDNFTKVTEYTESNVKSLPLAPCSPIHANVIFSSRL